MGSIFRLGFSFPASLPDALEELKKKGYSVLSSQLDGEPFFERSNIASSFVLVIGNEGNGISDDVKAMATHRLCLPMRGGAESLNAAVAAGIMMYDLTR
jgi:TrmH family RNA methyltransferase